MGTAAARETRRLNGWVVDDRGASARDAGAWLTSVGVLVAAAGCMALAMHRAWIGATGPGIAAVVFGALLTAAGWSCLRHADDHRARLMTLRRSTQGSAARRPSMSTTTSYGAGAYGASHTTRAGRQRVELLPVAALTTGR